MNEFDTALDLCYLAACAVNKTIPERERVERMDLDAVYALAKKHMLSAVCAFALESAGFKDKRSAQTIAAAVRRSAMFDRAYANIKKGLEERGIWFMPLKGAVLKSSYPKFGMREFKDCDVLFDASRAEEVREVMEEVGFTVQAFGAGARDLYHMQPDLNFEMHTSLFGLQHGKILRDYYANAEERLLGEGFEKHFSPEDHYVYLVSHEYRHYSGGGTGLRSFLDIYVFLRSVKLDMDLVRNEAEKQGIAEFEEQNREFALRLFGGGELSEKDREMLEYVLSSGVFGTVKNLVDNSIRRKGRLGYFMSRLSLPYECMCGVYPILKKAPVLYPYFCIRRLIRSLIFKRENVKYQLKASIKGRAE